MEKLSKLLKTATDILEKAGVVEASNDAWLLMEKHFGITRTQYYLQMDKSVDETEYIALVNRRAKHYPLQYITGEQYFMGLRFEVNESVLIPRYDTEVLVENVVKHIGSDEVMVLDVCTGSGCIAISIDKLCKNAVVTALDISSAALEVAKKNDCDNNSDVKFVKSDLFDRINNKYDYIVSNPPYIPTNDIYSLMDEVKGYEPVLALDGSSDGLEFYRRITADAVDRLNDSGYIFYEIGCEQAADVVDILKDKGFTDIEVIKDLAGLDRVVKGKYIGRLV